MFISIENLITPSELAQLRALLANAPWSDGRATAGPHAAGAKNNEQVVPDAPQAQQGRAIVEQAVRRNAQFYSAALPCKWVPAQFNRYSGQTNAYGPHVDNAIRLLVGDHWLRTDLSCTLFLSDPDSYDGGELSIEHSFGAVAIKLPAGHAVLYPSTSVHQVLPVTRGERLASFFWVESMVPDARQRALLYDMERAIQSLHAQVPNNPAATTLGGCYHNLLRMWAG